MEVTTSTEENKTCPIYWVEQGANVEEAIKLSRMSKEKNEMKREDIDEYFITQPKPTGRTER
jgi:hypothetical protein